MIPSALLYGRITCESKNMDFSVLEFSERNLKFRLPSDITIESDNVSVVMSFFFIGSSERVEIIPQIDGIECVSGDRYSNTYLMKLSGDDYAEASRRLTCEYLEYINSRLSMDESEIADKYLGYPCEKELEFSDSFRAWKDRTIGSLEIDSELVDKIRTKEIGLLLSSPSMYEKFMTLDYQDFISHYWNMSGVKGDMIRSLDISYLYVGNETCFHLLPSEDLLRSIILKANQLGLKLNLLLPPARGEKLCTFLKLVQLLPEDSEITVNDTGTAEAVSELGIYTVSFGSLYRTAVNDLRKKYLKDADLNSENNERSALFWPYSRISVFGNCGLKALCETGSRGKQKESAECRMYCRKGCILYPDFLSMVGIQNALYYVNGKFFGAVSDRVVFNFPEVESDD